jgi:hypothetical protein
MKPLDTGTLSTLSEEEIAALKTVIDDLRKGHGNIQYLFQLLAYLVRLLRRRAAASKALKRPKGG